MRCRITAFALFNLCSCREKKRYAPGDQKPARPLPRRGENPVAAGRQADDIADAELVVPGRVDLDRGLPLRQLDFGSLNWAEGADMGDRALEGAAAGRAELHVMTTDEKPRRTGRHAVRGNVERLAIQPHRAVAHLHR